VAGPSAVGLMPRAEAGPSRLEQTWMTRKRMARTHLIVTPAILAAVLVSAAPVRAADDAELEERLGALEARIAEQDAKIAKQDAMIGELQQEVGEDWLTEERSDQIRALVADVLDDADRRASLLNNGLMAGWDERFFLASADGRFKLELDGQLQVRWLYNYFDSQPNDRHRHGFEITRTKLTLRGHVFGPDLTYLVRTDATRNEPGLVEGLYFRRDAWVRYQLDDDWSVRAGLFKLPFNREELVSSAYQMAVERSLINENMNIGRSEGIEFTYLDDVQKFSVAVSDGGTDSLGGFGIAGGNPVNTPALDADVEWAVSARYERLEAGSWKQFIDFTSPSDEEFGLLWGIGIHAQRDEADGGFSFGRNETYWYAYTVDLSVEWGGASLFGSISHHYVDAPGFNSNTIGGVIQLASYVTRNVEPYLRWEYGYWDVSTGVGFPDLDLITLGANYYLDGHDVKWTTDIGVGISKVGSPWDSDIAGWRQDTNTSNPQIVFRTQLQLLF
jgi:uncharacterized coiled-coil protein SlyX